MSHSIYNYYLVLLKTMDLHVICFSDVFTVYINFIN